MGLKGANSGDQCRYFSEKIHKHKLDENMEHRENGANNNNNLNNGNGTRAHTDFSIDKILSDVTPSRTGVSSTSNNNISSDHRQRFYHPNHEYFNWNRRIYPPISIDVPRLFAPPTAIASTASRNSNSSETGIVNLSLRINDRLQYNSIRENLVHAKSMDYRQFYGGDVNALFAGKYEQYSRMYSISQNIKYFGIDFRLNDEFHRINNNNNNSISLNNNNNKSVAVKSELHCIETDTTDGHPNNLTCSVCAKVFENAHILEAHERTHKSPKYKCDECGKGFSQLRNFKYHVSVHKGTKEFAAKCPECDKLFNDKGYLSSHLKIHRNKKEYACPHCPKSFNQRVAFNMHARIHTGVKPHKCSQCGKCFSRKMLLKQHLRTHSGEKPYQCSICLKTFADRSNMTLHQRLHSGIKPFVCTICPKAFTKKHHLKTHLNYHIGCKPYVCPHDNCGKAFTQSSNMRTHSRKCEFKPPEDSEKNLNSN